MDQRNSSVTYSFRICVCNRVLCGNGAKCYMVSAKLLAFGAKKSKEEIPIFQRQLGFSKSYIGRGESRATGIFHFHGYCTNDSLKLILTL